VPGGIFGFARPAERVSEEVRSALEIPPHDDGLVPLSMLIMIPMLEAGSWQAHGLCSIEQLSEDPGRTELRRATLAAGLAVLGARTVYAVADWRSDDLALFARFSPLQLLTAWTPAHAPAGAATVRFELSPGRAAAALSSPTSESRADREGELVDVGDAAAARDLQQRIESGGRFEITSPPHTDGDRTLVPIREIAP
ncbi:MAG: hypothetical protein ACYTGG_01365, partial [Planctomycetota bacterium]